MTRIVTATNLISGKVIGAAFEVSNTLGCRFLEKVYENALIVELRTRGSATSRQVALDVLYRGDQVGTYYADLIVEGRLFVEIKAVRALDATHEAQCINYMKASGLSACLLLNFARPRLQFRRLLLRAREVEPRIHADERG